MGNDRRSRDGIHLGELSIIRLFLYEIVPGFIFALLVAFVVSEVTYKPNPEVEEEFDEAVRLAKQTKE